MRLLNPRNIDVGLKAEYMHEWDEADMRFKWVKLAETKEYKLGITQGRVIMVLHPHVEIPPPQPTVKEYVEKKEAQQAKRERRRRK